MRATMRRPNYALEGFRGSSARLSPVGAPEYVFGPGELPSERLGRPARTRHRAPPAKWCTNSQACRRRIPRGAPERRAQAVGWTARAARNWRSKAVGGESRLGAPKWNPWA